MAKKKSSKKRAQIKELPKKGKKLSKGDMKSVKGGGSWQGFYEPWPVIAPDHPRSGGGGAK